MKNKEISDLQKELADITLTIESLIERRKKVEKELELAQKKQNTDDLMREIFKVTDKNSVLVSLGEKTKTTPIMDHFVHSGKKFLVLKDMFILIPSRRFVSLVLVKGTALDVEYKPSELTMTNLKENSRRYISKDSLKYVSQTDRFYPLFEELSKLCGLELKKDLKCPINPCEIRGQTFSNQSGYGSEYCGEFLVREGTRYGETTKFFAIGVVVESTLA